MDGYSSAMTHCDISQVDCENFGSGEIAQWPEMTKRKREAMSSG
jgi:hypothetical protein